MALLHHYTSERAFRESAYNSSGIIHDINGMTGIILVMTETMAECIPENEKYRAYVAEIIRSVKQCTGLISTLQLDIFGSRSMRQTVGINSLIEEAAARIGMSGKPVVVTEFIEKTVHVVVHGNATETGAALMNLCINTMKTLDPALKFVLCSSIRDDIAPMEHDIVFLRKPFLKNELLKAINRAVPGTGTASFDKTGCTV